MNKIKQCIEEARLEGFSVADEAENELDLIREAVRPLARYAENLVPVDPKRERDGVSITIAELRHIGLVFKILFGQP